jgi:hypothetical protein
MGVLAIWESSKTTFCDFGVGALADLRTWLEQRSVDVIPNKTVQRLEQLGLIPELASLRESRRSEP